MRRCQLTCGDTDLPAKGEGRARRGQGHVGMGRRSDGPRALCQLCMDRLLGVPGSPAGARGRGVRLAEHSLWTARAAPSPHRASPWCCQGCGCRQRHSEAQQGTELTLGPDTLLGLGHASAGQREAKPPGAELQHQKHRCTGLSWSQPLCLPPAPAAVVVCMEPP